MNKKGSKYLSPWMFFIWVIIAIPIVIGVLMFNSSQGDIRSIDSDFLATRILDCLIDGFDYDEISNEEFDVYEKCDLNKDVLDESGNYYYSVYLLSDSGAEELFFGGESAWGVYCRAQEGVESIEGENLPRCTKKKAYVFDEKDYLLEVLAGVKKI